MENERDEAASQHSIALRHLEENVREQTKLLVASHEDKMAEEREAREKTRADGDAKLAAAFKVIFGVWGVWKLMWCKGW